MSNLYLYVSVFLFAFLSFIWSRKSWPDMIMKFGMFGMFVYGLVLVLQVNGLLIKI